MRQYIQLMGKTAALPSGAAETAPTDCAPTLRTEATEILRRVGLAERLSHYPKVLSGGEQQRVALARAFIVRPALLRADEPTGSLDFATGEKVMTLMFDLNREAGTTLVLVTHNRTLGARCERQLCIEAGRLVRMADEPAD